jgi:alkylation response protein AidB-like acyl-CoA dehydrogenase
MPQANVAKAEALLRSARGFFYETDAGVWSDVLADRAPDARQLAIARLARVNAVMASSEAVDLIYEAGGGSSIYATQPIETLLP